MASICVLKKIPKIQQILQISHAQLIWPRTASLLEVLNNQTRRPISTIPPASIAKSLINLETNLKLRLFSTNSGDAKDAETLNKMNTPSSIADFRAREESREEEFEKSADNQEDEQQHDNKTERLTQVRCRILDASLPFVSDHGWSRDAIAKGAETIGYPGVVHGMFPNGGIELIQHFYRQCNEDLIRQLKEEIEKNKSSPLSPSDFVTFAIKIRLTMIEPYQQQWPQAIAMMSLPQNVPTSLAQLLTMIDDICYYGGDRSVDFGWYTRRIGLATVFKMTELYMLQDSSIEHQDTWQFLDRRIEEGHQILSVLSFSDETSKNVSSAVSAAFITARNILGLNVNRR